MKKIHLLDCTLRDGGYINDWRFGEKTIAALVDYMWDAGNRSCRPYRKAIDLLVSDAYLEMLESNRQVIITERDAFAAAKHFSKDSKESFSSL